MHLFDERRGDTRKMSKASRRDVLKKLCSNLMVPWESAGVPIMSDLALYCKVKSAIEEAEKLESSKKTYSENEDWIEKKKKKFNVPFDISSKEYVFLCFRVSQDSLDLH